MKPIEVIKRFLSTQHPEIQEGKLMPKRIRRTVRSLDMGKLKSAIDAARNGMWTNLVNIQTQIETLDAHLASVLFKRTESLATYELYLKRGNNQILAQELMPLTQALLRSIIYGRVVIQILSLNKDEVDFQILPVDNVERDGKTYETVDGKVPFGFKPKQLYLIDSGGLGVITTAAPYSIYKINALGDYAQYAELYAMPVQDVSYKGNDPAVQQQIETILKDQGGNAARIWPEGVTVNTTNSASSAAKEVYSGLIEYCDSQISKLVLGQTMTTDSGASYSQSVTHKEQQEIVFAADRKFVGGKLRELLELHGVPCDEVIFQQVEAIDLKSTAEAMKAVNELIEIPKDYLYSLFGIPLPKNETNEINETNYEDQGTEEMV